MALTACNEELWDFTPHAPLSHTPIPERVCAQALRPLACIPFPPNSSVRRDEEGINVEISAVGPAGERKRERERHS